VHGIRGCPEKASYNICSTEAKKLAKNPKKFKIKLPKKFELNRPV
jgi:hypothetical protein